MVCLRPVNRNESYDHNETYRFELIYYVIIELSYTIGYLYILYISVCYQHRTRPYIIMIRALIPVCLFMYYNVFIHTYTLSHIFIPCNCLRH